MPGSYRVKTRDPRWQLNHGYPRTPILSLSPPPVALSSVSPQLSGETRSISGHAMGNNRVSRCTPSSSVIIVSNRRVSGLAHARDKIKEPPNSQYSESTPLQSRRVAAGKK